VHVLTELLHQNGEAIILAPKRGKTLQLFVQLATQHFCVEVTEEYDSVVFSQHVKLKEEREAQNGLYDADVHYPLLLKLRKLEH